MSATAARVRGSYIPGDSGIVSAVKHWGLHGGVAIARDATGVIRDTVGVEYRRTPERIKRENGRTAISSGAPIVTDIYPDGMYMFEGEAAREAWKEILPRLVVGKRPEMRDLQWVGHVWAADDGALLLVFDGAH